MTFDPRRHHRRSIRFKGYDYAQEGMYFVTIRVQGGSCLLGEIEDEKMILSAAGEMVQQVWHDLPFKFPSVQLDAFICMPNHIHFIVGLTDTAGGVGRHARLGDYDRPNVGAGHRARPDANEEPESGRTPSGKGQTRGSAPTDKRPSLPEVVQWYKSMTTTKYRQGVNHHGWPPFEKRFWQRNYYDQIIRNQRHLNAIRRYIENNPAAWRDNQLHPAAPENK